MSSFAAVAPAIQVDVRLSPPYSLSLSDYAASGGLPPLWITIMPTAVNINNLAVRLYIKMETNTGVTIETNLGSINRVLYLNYGVPEHLFGSDLAEYFNINKLNFKGYTKEAYQRTGQLPEGRYRFTVEVRDFNTGRTVSNQGTASAWIALGKPPELRTPVENAEMGQILGMPLTFSWIPPKVGAPGVMLQYQFEMWALRVPGISPYVVAASMPTFYTTTQSHNTLIINPAEHFFEPGMTYAWRVTASDVFGNIPFAQGGHSPIWTFTYQCKCDPVSNATIERKGDRATLSWRQAVNHTSFNVEIDQPGTNYSKLYKDEYNNTVTTAKLAEGATYRMRVQAICNGNSQNPSPFSEWQSVTVPLPTPITDYCPDCACEVPNTPAPKITNLNLRRDLQPGDTIHKASGKSRFVIESVTQESDGVYKGVFWFLWEYYRVQIPCNFWHLSVNTDNQITHMGFESINDPTFLLNLEATKAEIAKAADAVDNLANAAADAVATLTTNTTIKDSVKVNAPLKGAYINEDNKLVVVTENADGTLTETVAQSADNMDATLVTGSDGEEYVVTSGGQMMGKEEFAATGGNSRMVDKNNEAKEAKANPTVTFAASSEQKYGFDSYAENKSAIQNEYPELKAGYRPPFKSVESFKTDKVQANVGNAKDISFRTEMGVPVTESGKTLTVRGSYDGDEQALYAYSKQDSTETVVGKLNLLSFDTQKKKVYLVSVNGANLPNATTLQQELNRIYAPAVITWTVANAKAVTVTFANGKMTHGGSSIISVYNADQKAVIKAFGNMEQDALYLFFVNNVQGKDGNTKGYMPMQYQSGFIYDNTNAVTVAHELAHGAFNLAHTFSSEKFIAAQSSTDNLLDYKGGDKLWKHQWKLVNKPQSMFLKFLQDEAEAERKSEDQRSQITRFMFSLKEVLQNKDLSFSKTSALTTEDKNKLEKKEDIEETEDHIFYDMSLSKSFGEVTLHVFFDAGRKQRNAPDKYFFLPKIDKGSSCQISYLKDLDAVLVFAFKQEEDIPKFKEFIGAKDDVPTPLVSTTRKAFFVHGTDSDPERWLEHPLTEKVLLCIAGTDKFDDKFSWKEYNSLTQQATYAVGLPNRNKAAQKLVNYVLEKSQGINEIVLIGHSHGGNVSLQAVNQLVAKGKTVYLISIATPAYNASTALVTSKEDLQNWKFIRYVPQSSNYEFTNLENPKNTKLKQHLHLWNEKDGVAGGMAGQDYYNSNGITENVEILTGEEYTDFWTLEFKNSHGFDANRPQLIYQMFLNNKIKSIK
ncbi:hypothetical protein AGMMS49982_02940 [Bacteroidia bacterium]|nr:hypothetical protein AGMMS49982_02940 [Bacteroidia bacterium]